MKKQIINSKHFWALLGILVGAILGGLVLVKFAYATQTNPHKIIICHATGSNSNPFSQIEVDSSAIDGIGNSDHNRNGHQNGEDIIPPTYNNGQQGYWSSRNWNASGQAIWRNDCNSILPSPTISPTITISPTATPSATPSPSVSPSPTPIDECDGDCEQEPTPTPIDMPRVTPTETPSTPSSNNAVAPQCGVKNVEARVVNPHVYRNGDSAIVKWWPTAGNLVNIYYKQVGSPTWQYATQRANTGSEEINGLGTLDITFGIEEVDGCGGGVTSDVYQIVDGNSNKWVLFR